MDRPYRRKGEWAEVARRHDWPEDEGDLAAAMLVELRLPEPVVRDLLRNREALAQGGRLRLKLFPQAEPGFEPDWHGVETLYEDDFCLAAYKPAGVKAHPAEPGETGTLANRVAGHYAASGQACAVRHVHRLDEDTSGPVLYAKCPAALASLDGAMREKRIRRTYVAIVHGSPNPPSGRIDAPIGKDRHHRARRRVSPGGRPAVTRYETVASSDRYALVRLELETGRTHQIRVHMAHLGHPLAGDVLYGGERRGIARQALHGERLVFPHPWSGEATSVEAPWPDDFRALAEALKLD